MDAEELKPADHARALAARRRRVERECPVCGRRFTGTTRRRYCSPSCSVKAYRQRGERLVLPIPDPANLPPLIARLDATRAAISRGRIFEDSATVIREANEERDAEKWPEP
jgi:hypothetical protein